MGFLSYFFLAYSGLLDGVWTNILGQGPGAVLSAVMFGQIIIYDWVHRFGIRTNARGHYTARGSCETCRQLLAEIESGDLTMAPLPCSMPRCHGLAHIHVDRKRRRIGLILECDRCDVARDWLDVPRCGFDEANRLYVRLSDTPWREVEMAEFQAMRGGSSDSSVTLYGFMFHDGAEGVVVRDGQVPPKEQESATDYLERIRLLLMARGVTPCGPSCFF